MESLYGCFALLSLLLFASTINARTTPEEYWKQVMKDQPMPDALKGLVNSNPSQSVSKDMIKKDCHTSLNANDNKHLSNDILTDPTVTPFYDDVKERKNEDTKDKVHLANNFLNDPTGTAFYGNKDAIKMEEKDFVKDFEPRPNVSVYDNEEEKSFVKDFEPRPNVSVYHDEEEKSFAKDLEPRPNVSVYHDRELKGQKKAFAEDFEPRPNVSVYRD